MLTRGRAGFARAAVFKECDRSGLKWRVGIVLKACAELRVTPVGAWVIDRQPLDIQSLLQEREQCALTAREAHRKWELILEEIFDLRTMCLLETEHVVSNQRQIT